MDSDALTLGLLRASYNFHLPTLFEACERTLVSSVNVECCLEFHRIAEDVGANILVEKCLQFNVTRQSNSKRMEIENLQNFQRTEVEVGYRS